MSDNLYYAWLFVSSLALFGGLALTIIFITITITFESIFLVPIGLCLFAFGSHEVEALLIEKWLERKGWKEREQENE